MATLILMAPSESWCSSLKDQAAHGVSLRTCRFENPVLALIWQNVYSTIVMKPLAASKKEIVNSRTAA